MSDPSLSSPLLLESSRDKRLPRIVAALAPIALAGCTTFSSHLVPKPTSEGEFEVNLNADVYVLTEDAGNRNVGPALEANLRYGLSQLADIGLKLNILGVQANSRVWLVGQEGFDLAVVPSAGVTAADLTSGHAQALVATVGAPVIAGLHLGERAMLIFGTHAEAHLGTVNATQTVNGVAVSYPGELVLYPGGILGMMIQLRDRFAVFPELNLLFPYLTHSSKFARPVLQGGIAFQFRSGD